MVDGSSITSSIAVDVSDLQVSYEGQLLYNHLNLQVAPGEKVALTGRSGSGKSSLLHCLMGFFPPQQGAIRIDGTELNSRNVWTIRQKIAYVPQESQLGLGTVREVIEQPFHFKANRSLPDHAARLDTLFRQFELPPSTLDKQIDDLSGGEKQRVSIIIADLLTRPIWLMDEPTSALDRQNKTVLSDYLRQQTRLTVLMVTHDSDLLSAAHRCVDLADLQTGGCHD